jgi:hypothetical protein
MTTENLKQDFLYEIDESISRLKEEDTKSNPLDLEANVEKIKGLESAREEVVIQLANIKDFEKDLQKSLLDFEAINKKLIASRADSTQDNLNLLNGKILGISYFIRLCKDATSKLAAESATK